MKYLILVLLALSLTACGLDTYPKGYGDKRNEYFVQCMELAAKVSANTENKDTARVVRECNIHSSFMMASYTKEYRK